MSKAEWIGQNPLFLYRRKHGFTQADVAAELGVGHHRVYCFENGMAIPSEDQMKKLSDLTKIKNLHSLWQQWLSSRPKLN